MRPKSFVGRAPLGELTALPRPLAGFKGPTSKEGEGREGVGGEGREGEGRSGERREGEGRHSSLPLHMISGYATDGASLAP